MLWCTQASFLTTKHPMFGLPCMYYCLLYSHVSMSTLNVSMSTLNLYTVYLQANAWLLIVGDKSEVGIIKC